MVIFRAGWIQQPSRGSMLASPTSDKAENVFPIGTHAHMQHMYTYIHGWPHRSTQADTQGTQMNTICTNTLIVFPSQVDRDKGLLVGIYTEIQRGSLQQLSSYTQFAQ